MNKSEKVFWTILVFLTGLVLGAVIWSILEPPVLEEQACTHNGKSMQIEQDGDDIIVYDTYIPALDECK